MKMAHPLSPYDVRFKTDLENFVERFYRDRGLAVLEKRILENLERKTNEAMGVIRERNRELGKD